jgi:hypothetical protein
MWLLLRHLNTPTPFLSVCIAMQPSFPPQCILLVFAVLASLENGSAAHDAVMEGIYFHIHRNPRGECAHSAHLFGRLLFCFAFITKLHKTIPSI